MDKESNWHVMTTPQERLQPFSFSTEQYFSRTPTSPPINIGSSVWFAQQTKIDSWHNSSVMMEYNLENTTISPLIPYPAKFDGAISGPRGFTQQTIQYKEHLILVLSPSSGCAIIFDTKTLNYGDVLSFTGNFNYDASCIAIGEHIHIFQGHGGDYTIYSVKDKSARTLSNHYCCESKRFLGDVPVIKSNGSYQSSNKRLITGFTRQPNGKSIPSVIGDLISKFCEFELFKFGGWHTNEESAVDSFYVGTLRNEDATEPVDWKLVPEWKLKHPMTEFGCIQYGSFVVTFGGLVQHWGLSFGQYLPVSESWITSIYILDLRKDEGWIESPIRCPEKAKYIYTVLDETQRVLLFPVSDGSPWKHYWIDVEDLIPQSM